GLLISVMISFISQIIGNNVLNHFVPIIVTIILGYLGFQFGLRKRDEMLLFLPENMTRSMAMNTRNAMPKVIDSSGIIDVHMLDVIECGCVDGEMIIRQGEINDMQVIADANDSVKRGRSQRGFDMLKALHDAQTATRIIQPTKSHSDIDARL